MKSFIYKSCLFLVILFAGIKAYSVEIPIYTKYVIVGETICINLSEYFNEGERVYLISPINPDGIELGAVSAHCMTGLIPSDSGIYEYYKVDENGIERRLIINLQVINPIAIINQISPPKTSIDHWKYLKPRKLTPC